MPAYINNLPLKSGFIFLPSENARFEAPEKYLAVYMGGYGLFAKLNPESANGWDYVTTLEYEQAI